MKPSAVRRSGVDATLTNSTPSCLRLSRSSAVGLAGVCPQILMPGALRCTVAELLFESRAAAPKASLPNSLRWGRPPGLPCRYSETRICQYYYQVEIATRFHVLAATQKYALFSTKAMRCGLKGALEEADMFEVM